MHFGVDVTIIPLAFSGNGRKKKCEETLVSNPLVVQTETCDWSLTVSKCSELHEIDNLTRKSTPVN